MHQTSHRPTWAERQTTMSAQTWYTIFNAEPKKTLEALTAIEAREAIESREGREAVEALEFLDLDWFVFSPDW